MVNLLQCRPLQVDSAKSVAMPVCEDSQVVFDLRGYGYGTVKERED